MSYYRCVLFSYPRTWSVAWRGVDWGRGDGLLPGVVQEADTLQGWMLGYVRADSRAATLAIGHMTFFSRSKQRLWTKGEQSGNVLVVQSISVDCDADTLLVIARPAGPTAPSCVSPTPWWVADRRPAR